MTGDERKTGVVLCGNCREVYSVWIRPDGEVYPISSHKNCSCDARNVALIGDA